MAQREREKEAWKVYDEAKEARAKVKLAYEKATKVENDAWHPLNKIIKDK